MNGSVEHEDGIPEGICYEAHVKAQRTATSADDETTSEVMKSPPRRYVMGSTSKPNGLCNIPWAYQGMNPSLEGIHSLWATLYHTEPAFIGTRQLLSNHSGTNACIHQTRALNAYKPEHVEYLADGDEKQERDPS